MDYLGTKQQYANYWTDPLAYATAAEATPKPAATPAATQKTAYDTYNLSAAQYPQYAAAYAQYAQQLQYAQQQTPYAQFTPGTASNSNILVAHGLPINHYEKLMQVFSAYGPVEYMKVGPSGPNFVAFITYRHEYSVQAALACYALENKFYSFPENRVMIEPYNDVKQVKRGERAHHNRADWTPDSSAKRLRTEGGRAGQLNKVLVLNHNTPPTDYNQPSGSKLDELNLLKSKLQELEHVIKKTKKEDSLNTP
jgi:hypothetical protein